MNWLKKLFLAWWNVIKAGPKPKPSTGSATPSDAPAAVNTTGPLVDPPAPYTDAYMSAHAEHEECGIEADRKIVCRFMVWRGMSTGWWMISSLGMNRVQRESDGNGLRCDDWTEGEYSYHIRGGCDYEPQSNEAQPKLTVTGNRHLPKYVLCEVRKAQ